MGMLNFFGNWLFALVILALGLVFFFYGIRFFKEGSEYYRAENKARTQKHEQMSELLAKLDQLVDVLKVK